MLILSRKEGETIQIGDGVKIVIISSDRRGVRVGIEAPPDVRILRGEIVAQVTEETQRAAQGPAKEWVAALPIAPRP
ncbi:MAG: carbon storage regulator [Gemmatimonadaceae bacterium]|nr:carbon storage regulator [Gemmatimonadaceae bacterium]